MRTRSSLVFAFLGLGLVGILALLSQGGTEGLVGRMSIHLPLWSVLPFIILLLTIAIAPLSIPHLWEKNGFKALVSAVLAIPVALFLILGWGSAGVAEVLEKSRDYVSFIALLAALYVIAGGVFIKGSFSGTPIANTAFLAIGAVLANLVGTTGASMLLIRPLIRANASRQRKVHIFVFFIFVVSNVGGLLTPLGDPPLFLGFLKGVPFEWPFIHLALPWLFTNAIILIVFNLFDQAVFNKEELIRTGSQLEEVRRHEPFHIEGWINVLLLAGVLGVVIASGQGLGNGGNTWAFGVAETLMVGLALLSLILTKWKIHEENGFSFSPIAEVAILFAGIFITMGPALLILNAAGDSFGITRPWQFFWAAGSLSSFLDNAPTYLTFSALASGILGVPAEGRFIGELLLRDGGTQLLTAVAAGSVMMGANSYIGNGPNFMVKAIVEGSGVRMPSFFGYMLYSVGILVPIFILVTIVFFR
ncbi:MAG: sodium:proton antiporter [Spirochaetota bacterium]